MSKFDEFGPLEEEVIVNPEMASTATADEFGPLDNSEDQQVSPEKSFGDKALEVAAAAPGYVANTVRAAVEATSDILPGSVQLSAAGNTAVDYGLSKYYGEEFDAAESYERNKAMVKNYRLQTRSDYRLGSGIGDAGSIIGTAAVGGAAISGLSKIDKFGKVINAFKPVLSLVDKVFKTGKQKKIAATFFNSGVDATVGFGQFKYLDSKDITPEKITNMDYMDMLAMSLGLRSFGNIALGTGKNIGVWADAMSEADAVNLNIFTRAGVKATNRFKKFKSDLLDKGVDPKTIDREVGEYLEDVGAKNLENIQNPEVIRVNGRNKLKEIGKQMDDAIESLDETFGNTIVGFDDAYSNLTKKSNSKNTSDIVRDKILGPAKIELDKILMGPNGKPKEMTVRQLWNEIKDVEKLGLDDDVAAEITESLRKSLTKYTDDFFRAADANSSKYTEQIVRANNLVKDKAEEAAEVANEIMLIKASGKTDPDTINMLNQLTQEADAISKSQQGLQKNVNDLVNMEAKTSPMKGAERGTVSRSSSDGGTKRITNVDGQDPIRANNKGKEFKDLSRKYYRYKNMNKVVAAMDTPKSPQSVVGAAMAGSVKLGAAGKATIAYTLGGPMAAGTIIAGDAVYTGLKQTVKNMAIDNTAGLASKSGKFLNFLENVGKMPDNVVMQGFYKETISALNSEHMNEEELFKLMDSNSSKAELYIKPLERTTESVKNNLDTLISITNKEAPELTSKILDALDLQEASETDLGLLMDTFSKQPKLMKFFKAGQGWDGKIVDPEEKKFMAMSIEKDLNIPKMDRERVKKEFMATGVPPDLSQFQRQPKVYKPIDKSKPRN